MLKSLYVFHSPEKVEKLEKISRRGAPRHGSCRSRIRACYVEKSPRIKRRASTIIRESRVLEFEVACRVTFAMPHRQCQIVTGHTHLVINEAALG